MRIQRWFTVAILVATGAVVACKKKTGDDDSSKVAQSGNAPPTTAPNNDLASPTLALPVRVEPAIDGDLVITVLTKGIVQSEAQGRLQFEAPGVIARVFVRPGQTVKKGDTLATLDTVPFALAMRKAQLEFDRASMDYRDRMAESIAFGRTPTAEQRVTAELRSGLRAATFSMDEARIARARAVLLAPYAGVIDRVNATPGERSDQSGASITLVDIVNLRIEARVLEHYMALVRDGGQALVTTTADPERRLYGRITSVLPLVDSVEKGVGRAYVMVTNNGVLRPGMTVDVQLETKRLTNRRLVPAKAVTLRDDRPLVFVVKDGRADWVYFRIGRTNGIHTEVLPDSVTGELPIKPKDQVIVMGHQTLTHQAPVRVISPDEIKK
jgi:RND family efflux transporter MFP subunit